MDAKNTLGAELGRLRLLLLNARDLSEPLDAFFNIVEARGSRVGNPSKPPPLLFQVLHQMFRPHVQAGDLPLEFQLTWVSWLTIPEHRFHHGAFRIQGRAAGLCFWDESADAGLVSFLVGFGVTHLARFRLVALGSAGAVGN